MKEMCLPCYGTGRIACLVCGGTGTPASSSVLGDDCRKCNGSGIGRCQRCSGSGFTGGDTLQSRNPTEAMTEAMIDMTLVDSFPASDPPGWTLGLDI